jgi:hypothetical protein
MGEKPTAAHFFSQQPTQTLMPLSTSVPITEVMATQPPSSKVITNSVFSDQLSSNWDLIADPGMQVDPQNTTHVHSGNVSVAMSPQKDFSKLSFLVNQKSVIVYPRDQVTSINFWLNSGNDTVILSDLIVKVLGSNTTPYWTANDTSVPLDNDIFLQETRLYFLGLNKSIPADTWVEVTVNLDNLTHDPNYKYVTGFYIKNDAGFLRTVYIDDVDIVMIDNGGQSMLDAIPATTITSTPMTTPERTQAEISKNGIIETRTPRR